MRNLRNVFGLLAVLLVAMPVLPAFGAELPPAQSVARSVRCPVCGMYPSRYPKWMVQVVYNDRSMAAFDSPADFFRFRQDIGKYVEGRTAGDIGAIYFSDFQKGGWIESGKAFFVSGSDARGPMNNDDLPVFGNREVAETFAREHGGQVLTYDRVTPDVLKTSSAGHAHDHQHGHHHGH